METRSPADCYRFILGRKSSPASAPVTVVLYTRAGCHLCNDAKALIERYRESFPLTLSEVDIDEEQTLRARYDLLVPVVVIDGVERFRGRINEVLLRRLLEARHR